MPESPARITQTGGARRAGGRPGPRREGSRVGKDSSLDKAAEPPVRSFHDSVPERVVLLLLYQRRRGSRPVRCRQSAVALADRTPSTPRRTDPAGRFLFHSWSRSMRVAIQGTHGSFSEAAARRRWPDLVTLPCREAKDVVAAVRAGQAEAGCLPIEN